MSDAKPPAPKSSTSRLRRAWRLGTVVVAVLAGLLIAGTATTSGGTDLRPARAGDLAGLVANEEAHNAQLTAQIASLRSQVDRLSAQQDATLPINDLATAGLAAGTTPVHGPAVRVTLNDAPLSVAPVGVDPDLLVVHQQDIQQVVNALWAGGAEAMTIQDVRVVATTGIKCVGNTVVLHGTPYAPPYVITAIGDPARLEAALNASEAVGIYKQYVTAYQLGYSQVRLGDVAMPGYAGPLPGAASVAGG